MLRILRVILQSDGGINFMLLNYHTLSHLKQSFDNYSTICLGEHEAYRHYGSSTRQDHKGNDEELRSRFLAHILGDQELVSISQAELPKLAIYTIELMDSLRDLTILLNRYFSSLYALSDDQSLIANLSGLAQGLHSSIYSTRVFHFIVSQHRQLASLLVVIKLKTTEELASMKFEVAIVLDILWTSKLSIMQRYSLTMAGFATKQVLKSPLFLKN